MDIFSRLSDLLQSNLNDLIDRAEDPEKMVRQIIADMQTELNKAVQNYGKIKSGRILTEKKYQDALKASFQWENKAKTALSHGDNPLAEQLVLKKVQADEEAAVYKEMYDTVKLQEETMKAQVETLRLKIDEAKSRQEILIVRKKMADTQKRLSEISGNLDNTQENNGSGTEEENTLKKELSSKVSSELARLMAEMNIDNSIEE
ncbi:MAG: PspA/IM30 family protein [Ruminococcus sp.]|nr:PspA/IM30 family protein [Ruminococcus sp.]